MLVIPIAIKILLTIVALYFILIAMGWVTNPAVKNSKAVLSLVVFFMMAAFLVFLYGGLMI